MTTRPSDMLRDNPYINRSLFCFKLTDSMSAGVWLGDDPLKFYFPLLLYQVCIIFAVSHAVHAILRRVNQPLAISQIIAGVLLGPSCLGRIGRLTDLFTMPEAWLQLNTVALVAFSLFVFIIGVKTDISMITKSGSKAAAIALFGSAVPHLAMYVTSIALGSNIPSDWAGRFLLVNVASRWSLTSYIVLCCALDDLNLLTSNIGRLAMSAALIAEFANTFITAAVTSYLLSSAEQSQKMGLASLAAFIGFMAFIMFVARPAMLRLIRGAPEGGVLDEARLVAVLLLALTCGLVSDIVGLHAPYGTFLLGLVLPGGQTLGVTMAERVDRLVSGVLLPLFLAAAGLRLDVFTLRDTLRCTVLEVFLLAGSFGKFVGTMLPCIYFRMPVRDAITLGLMMNLKGIREVSYSAHWQDSMVVDNQLYTVFMLTVIVITGTAAPLVKWLYRPEDHFVACRRRTVQHSKPSEELRVVSCIHSQADVGPVLALLDASNPAPLSPLAIYLLHLVPLTGRTNAVFRPFKRSTRKSYTSASDSEHIVNAFRFFAQERPEGAVNVLPYVCISPYATMHDDVCALALEKRAVLIILPFHKRLAIDGSVENNTSHACAVHTVNVNVLTYSPCSVAILVDRGVFSASATAAAAAAGLSHNIAVYFLGGPDDREALAIAAHMAEDPSIGLTVLRFKPPPEWQQGNNDDEDNLDEEMITEFVRRRVDDQRVMFCEEVASSSDEMVAVIRETSTEFTLLIVGRRAESRESPFTAGLSEWSEHPELGIIGDLLASTDFGCPVSTLVVQQQSRVAAGDGQQGVCPGR